MAPRRVWPVAFGCAAIPNVRPVGMLNDSARLFLAELPRRHALPRPVSEKGHVLNSTISIVLPVHNAEKTIQSRVGQLLEVLPEMTAWFEILIIDDGSTDQTCEIVGELARRYPQVRVLRNRGRMGVAKSTRVGFEQSRGDVVFVDDQRTAFRESDLDRLWAMRDDKQLLMARAEQQPRPIRPALMRQLMDWGAAVSQLSAQQGEYGGMQMIRRRAVHQLSQSPTEADVDASVSVDSRSASRPSPRQTPPLLAKLKEVAVAE